MPAPQCPICYELFIGWKEIAACPCGHTFHYHCVLRWSEDCKRARRRPECPTCKTSFDCDKPPKSLLAKLYFAFDGDEAESEWNSGGGAVSNAADSETLNKLREELNSKNASTYTLQNRITVLEKEAKDWVEKVSDQQLKCQRMEREVKEEKTKRETIRRQMEGFKMQAGSVQRVHEENELMKKKLEECKTIEKVLKDSTNQVEAELKDHGRSAEELAKYLIILKREMERHVGEKRKFKEEAKKASEENFKFENELDRLRREIELKQEKLDEVRKDNAALLKRIRLSQSPMMPTKRRAPIASVQNSSPSSLGDKTNFASPGEKEEGGSAKRKRIDRVDLDSSMDLFGSPVLPHPGLIETPPLGRTKPSLSSAAPTSVATPNLLDGRPKSLSLDDADSASPSLGLAKETGVKYVKTKTDFDAISKLALGAVVTPESVVPVRRPTGVGGGGLLGRVGGGGGTSVRTGYNATGGTSKFLDVRSQSVGSGSGSSCGGGLPRVASFSAKPSSSAVSKFHKSVVDQQKKNKQPSLNGFFGT